MSTRLSSATHPVIVEINTWPWLNRLSRLSRGAGAPIQLGTVPDQVGRQVQQVGHPVVDGRVRIAGTRRTDRGG